MSFIDYGALLRINGKLINKGILFMENSDTGYVCKKALDEESGKSYNIAGNYFVYAGDENLLLAFYKCNIAIISNEKMISTLWEFPFKSETFKFPEKDIPDIKVSRLDNTYYTKYWKFETWETFLKEEYCFLDETAFNDAVKCRNKYPEYKKFLRLCKRLARGNHPLIKNRHQRFLAEWKYNGKKYEVIFGYGVDPDKEVWEEVIDKYEFTSVEQKIIRKWFMEEKNNTVSEKVEYNNEQKH